MQVTSLSSLPHDQIRALLESGVPVYVSVNPVEYHGPHLPLDTDALLSHSMILATHAKLGDELTRGLPPLLADPIPYGANPTPGPGTENTPYRELRALVLKRCRALARLGAKRVVLTTFHGGPFHNLALWDGVRWLESQGIAAIAPFNLVFEGLLEDLSSELEPVFAPIADPAMREKVAREFHSDFHAGFWETSLMIHFHPASVSSKQAEVPPCPYYAPNRALAFVQRCLERLGLKRTAAELSFLATGLGWMSLRPFPGYTGWPHLANARSGAAFAELLTERYVKATRAVLLERKPGPQPILRFLRPLTFGGLLAP